jgi:[acyl-carrier-protein] S-malonyltransferase
MAKARYDEDSVAALFDGQGIFQPGMGKTAFDNYAAAREVFKDASDAAGIDMRRICFGDLISFQDDTRFIQPAIATVDLAEYAAWREREERDADVVTGLSMGMYPAMGAAGVFESFGQTIDIVAKRARIMHEIAKKQAGQDGGYYWRGQTRFRGNTT